jgi:hypothetical protein
MLKFRIHRSVLARSATATVVAATAAGHKF